MAVAGTIIATEAGTLAVYNTPSKSLRATEGGVLSVFRETAGRVSAEQAQVSAVFHQTASIRTQNAGVLAVVAGRVANPQVRAWTFSLDTHDFYVLRLGDDSTIIYDLLSEQWVDWDSLGNGAWRPNTGFTWVGAQALAFQYGSSIVVGDDTFGLLWFLDPLQSYDDAPDPMNDRQQIPFERVLSAQSLASGRKAIPCYAIFVDGDNYGLVAQDFTPGIKLETSDDQGRTFTDYGTLTVIPDPSVNNPYGWYSLGQITSPGRIFRLTDNGVHARVDSMAMNDDG